MDQPPAWTEEASRAFFIYSVAFASGLALAQNYFVSIEYFYNKFPIRIQRILTIITPLIIFVLFAIIMVCAFNFTMMGYAEYSPSMKIRMSTVFFSMVLMSIGLCFYSLKELLQTIKYRI